MANKIIAPSEFARGLIENSEKLAESLGFDKADGRLLLAAAFGADVSNAPHDALERMTALALKVDPLPEPPK